MTTGVQDSDGFPGTTATKASPVAGDLGVIADSADNFKLKKATLSSMAAGGGAVLSVSGTAGRITSTGGANPVLDIDATYVGQASITTLGTIGTGVWNATAIGVTKGGTGLTSTTINQILYSSAANTISGLATANSGVLATTSAGVPVILGPMTDGQILIGSTGATPVVGSITAGSGVTVTPSAGGIQISATGSGGTVTSVIGTANRITSTGGATPQIDIDAAYVGQASITTLGTITTGVWQGTLVDLAHGGSNANLTASNGGIVYSDATKMQILSGTATAGQIPRSGANAAPSWSTATYPATTTANRLLYSSAANTIADLATANNSILATDGSGVPSLTTSLPTAVQVTVSSLNSGTSASSSTYWRGDGTWAPIAGASGGLIKLGTVNTTAATVDFTNLLTSTYDDYMVVVKYAVPATNAVTGTIRVGTGAGPTYQTTNYQGVGCFANNGAPGAQTSGTSGLDFTLASRWSNTSTTGLGGTFIINNANSGTNNKTITGLGTYKDSTGGIEFGWWLAGQWQASTVITSLRFLTSSGNITLTATLYGFEK